MKISLRKKNILNPPTKKKLNKKKAEAGDKLDIFLAENEDLRTSLGYYRDFKLHPELVTGINSTQKRDVETVPKEILRSEKFKEGQILIDELVYYTQRLNEFSVDD